MAINIPDTHKLAQIDYIPDEVKIKPAMKPKYNARIHSQVLIASARISAKYACEVGIFPTYYGYHITCVNNIPSFLDFIVVNGREIRTYKRDIEGIN